MTARRVLCALAGCVVLLSWLGLLLALVWEWFGLFLPRPVFIPVVVVTGGLGLFGGGLMADAPIEPEVIRVPPEQAAFAAAVLADLDALPVIADGRNTHQENQR